MSERARPTRWVVLRDLGSFLAGWALIFKQAGILFAPPSRPSEVLILVAAVAIGLPGAAQLLQSRTPTATPPSSPPEEASSSSSPGA